MLSSLLTTKLYIPPARAALVPRPRLVERLQEGLRGPLTLISAPPGSGKTSLLSEWRAGAGCDTPLAWLSLDGGDNDPIRFFHHLAAALDLVKPGVLAEITPLLEMPGIASPEALLTPLINLLHDMPQDFVAALDDYHVIEAKVIHSALVFLLEHLPARMHLALLTRADPPLPLARFRARGQLVEIRVEQLRFSLEETASFLNEIMHLDLTPEQVEALEKRTEGWVAGLQLAALSMQGRADLDGFISAFTGSNHYIVDYLAEEVLERQPERVRGFLLQTCVLERLSGSLCDALTGEAEGGELLEELDHANLFVIPLDSEQRWYRYHALFADLLRSRLMHSQPEEAKRLHEAASGWFEANGFPDEAIGHALAAGNYPLAARLFCRDSLQVIYTRPLSTLEHWLGSFPAEFLLGDPRLAVARMHVLWSEGRYGELEPFFTAGEAALARKLASGELQEGTNETAMLRGEILIFKSLHTMINLDHQEEAAIGLAQQALETIPKEARSRAFALGSLYIAYGSIGETSLAEETAAEAVELARVLDYPSMQATAAYTRSEQLCIMGKYQLARQVLQEALDYAERRGQSRLFYNGILHIGMAEMLYNSNSLEEMEKELRIGLLLSRQGGMNILVALGLFVEARLDYARGGIQKALEALDRIERECRGMDPTAYQDDCNFQRLRWQARSGELAGAKAYLEALDRSVGRHINANHYHRQMLGAELLHRLGRQDEALEILAALEPPVRRDGLNGWLAHLLAHQGLTWWEKKDTGRALECFKEALALSEKEKHLRLFLDLGESVRAPLAMLRRQGCFVEFTSRILGEEGAVETQPAAAAPALLSKREIELLRLIAEGCSNKEIAARLVISLGTVKRHTVNIFTKLDVGNRTEAVARGRELKLL